MVHRKGAGTYRQYKCKECGNTFHARKAQAFCTGECKRNHYITSPTSAIQKELQHDTTSTN